MKQDKRVGGNLQQALEQKHSFNPLEVLKEGVNLTKGTIPNLLGAALLTLAIFTIFLMLAIQFFLGEFDVESPSSTLVMLMIQIIVMSPLLAGIHMMGIRHSVGSKTRASDVFIFVRQPFPFILIALLTQVATQLTVGILPGVVALLAVTFISVTLSMALPLAAEYKLSPIQAMRCSFIAVFKRFGSFFSVYIALFALILVGLFTFGIALIFVVPLFYNVKGIMYREIFGVAVADTDASSVENNIQKGNGPKDTDTWSA